MHSPLPGERRNTQAPLRVLLTNKTLAHPGGTQLYVLDVANTFLPSRSGFGPAALGNRIDDLERRPW